MKTTRLTTYGGAIELADADVPQLRPTDVLVRVEAVAVTAGDHRIWSGKFPAGFTAVGRLGMGITKPRMTTLGGCFSGEVTAVGAKVADVTVGEMVAGMSGAMGAHAQLLRIPAKKVAPKAEGLGHQDAAALLFGGTTALHFLRDKARLQAGEKVLVNGASGAVGSAAVQVAKHLGARVTAVCSEANAELVRRLGADEVIDYKRHPVAELDERFDVVLDAVGNISRVTGLALLTPGGRLILAVASLVDTLRARGQVIAGVAAESRELIAEVLALGAAGVLDPVGEVLGGLDQVEAGLRRISTGRKVGNLVVTPAYD